MMPYSQKDNISDDRMKNIKDLLMRLNINIESSLFKLKDSSWEILNEALTHTSAQRKINHERLEFLGDAVLRLAASEFIDRKYPSMNVGERSALRSQIVSDFWLAKVGKDIGIEKVLIMGPKASKDQSALTTLQAESTEALIGALYKCFYNLDSIHTWLTPYWEETSLEVLSDPHKQNSKSALQEWSQGRKLKLPKYETIETTKNHGDSKRFFCTVNIENQKAGEGYGGSIKEAEKEAANSALKNIENLKFN